MRRVCSLGFSQAFDDVLGAVLDDAGDERIAQRRGTRARVTILER